MGCCTTLPKSNKICTNTPTQQQFNPHNTKSPKPQKSVEKNQDKLENIELRKQLIEVKESYNQTILKLQRINLENHILNEQLNKQKIPSQQDSINAYVVLQEDEEEIDKESVVVERNNNKINMSAFAKQQSVMTHSEMNDGNLTIPQNTEINDDILGEDMDDNGDVDNTGSSQYNNAKIINPGSPPLIDDIDNNEQGISPGDNRDDMIIIGDDDNDTPDSNGDTGTSGKITGESDEQFINDNDKNETKSGDETIEKSVEQIENEEIEEIDPSVIITESIMKGLMMSPPNNKKEQNDTQLNKQKIWSQQDSINEEEEGEDDPSVNITESIMQGLMMSPLNNWKYKDGILSIKVINAINVDNMDEDVWLDGVSDLYVILELAGNYGTTQTKTIYNEENPVWNERFQLITDNPKTDILKCTVWDENKRTFDDKIGYVEINVIDIITENNGCIECKGFDVCDSQIGYKLYLDIKYWEVA